MSQVSFQLVKIKYQISLAYVAQILLDKRRICSSEDPWNIQNKSLEKVKSFKDLQ